MNNSFTKKQKENESVNNNVSFLNKKYNEYIGKKRALIDNKNKGDNSEKNKMKKDNVSKILEYLDNNELINQNEINKNYIDYISNNLNILKKLLNIIQNSIQSKQDEDSIQLKEKESPEKNNKLSSKRNGMNKRIIDAKEKKKLMSLHNLGLGLHFHKDKEGKIYKYSKNNFLGRDICIFNCDDNECNSTANYIMSDGKFIINIEHNKKHEEHSYIKKPDKDNKIIEEFKNKNFNEAQVFRKDNGPKIIQWYD